MMGAPNAALTLVLGLLSHPGSPFRPRLLAHRLALFSYAWGKLGNFNPH